MGTVRDTLETVRDTMWDTVGTVGYSGDCGVQWELRDTVGTEGDTVGTVRDTVGTMRDCEG